MRQAACAAVSEPPTRRSRYAKHAFDAYGGPGAHHHLAGRRAAAVARYVDIECYCA